MNEKKSNQHKGASHKLLPHDCKKDGPNKQNSSDSKATREDPPKNNKDSSKFSNTHIWFGLLFDFLLVAATGTYVYFAHGQW